MSASITSGTYPRAGARSSAASPVRSAANAVWRFLVRLGAARAQPELLRLSRLHAQTNPALSRQLKAAAHSLLNG